VRVRAQQRSEGNEIKRSISGEEQHVSISGIARLSLAPTGIDAKASHLPGTGADTAGDSRPKARNAGIEQFPLICRR
jgi:hypothetical protein